MREAGERRPGTVAVTVATGPGRGHCYCDGDGDGDRHGPSHPASLTLSCIKYAYICIKYAFDMHKICIQYV